MVFAIILGAFGAHGLKARLSESDLDVFKTGVLYQFIHGFGLLILGILGQIFPDLHFKRSAIFFGLGILCFSGSLYLLSTQTITGLNGSFLGPITPLGGLFFIVGWSLTALQFLKKNAN
ncbi:UNVERIFIED_CONTAM: hypothetical protein GTU68_007685 [Idotea baltica]|nr:hypothetical protein [Idotea baltica]